jgi:hypothetical protein
MALSGSDLVDLDLLNRDHRHLHLLRQKNLDFLRGATALREHLHQVSFSSMMLLHGAHDESKARSIHSSKDVQPLGSAFDVPAIIQGLVSATLLCASGRFPVDDTSTPQNH